MHKSVNFTVVISVPSGEGIKLTATLTNLDYIYSDFTIIIQYFNQ